MIVSIQPFSSDFPCYILSTDFAGLPVINTFSLSYFPCTTALEPIILPLPT